MIDELAALGAHSHGETGEDEDEALIEHTTEVEVEGEVQVQPEQRPCPIDVTIGSIFTDEEDEDEELGRIRLSITRGQAIAFCEHAVAAVSAGRPPCHWCDGVVDPDGHVCPRMN